MAKTIHAHQLKAGMSKNFSYSAAMGVLSVIQEMHQFLLDQESEEHPQYIDADAQIQGWISKLESLNVKQFTVRKKLRKPKDA